jgi:hypothetical protein
MKMSDSRDSLFRKVMFMLQFKTSNAHRVLLDFQLAPGQMIEARPMVFPAAETRNLRDVTKANCHDVLRFRAQAISESRVAPTFDSCSEVIELNAKQGAEWKIQTLTKTLA